MNVTKAVQGVVAALLTPRDAAGEVLESAFAENVAFVRACGADGICINGATGEYHQNTLAQCRQLLRIAKESLGRGDTLVCSVGAARPADTLAFGREAMEAGATALLLPAPHFFQYPQDDIATWCRQIASELPLPILLYNLPQFTNGFEAATALELIDSVPNIVGIKDSSGSLDILRTLTERGHEGVCRIVGNDQALVEAVQSGWCDGVISGVAGVLPELTVSVFHKPECHRERLDQLIEQLNNWPTPWGLKLIGEFRRMAEARLPYPLSPARQSEAAAFGEWFNRWWQV